MALEEEAVEQVPEAQDVGVLGEDAALLVMHQRVGHAEGLDARGAQVCRLGGHALVGDGHVQAAPRALADERHDLVGLQLYELVGTAAEARVDLGAPTVAERAPEQAEGRLRGRRHQITSA